MKIKKTVTELKQEKLMKKHFAKLNKPSKKKKRSSIESDSVLRKMKYADFLKSKYWAKVRKLVFKRDNYQCVICHENKQLQAHHNTYAHHFDELNHLADLLTLCNKCHKEHHYAQGI